MENDAIPMVILVQNKFTFTPSENALIIIMNVPRSNWWSIGANGTIGTKRKAPYSNGSVGAYASN